MRQLPEQYAQALQQRYLQGESVGQLARAMKLSYKGAESLLSRARQAFKAAFNRGDA
jgi:DNA-directed RNA polymerase specialized sigma24 family protein